MTTKAQWAELGIRNAYELVKLYAEDTGGYGVYLSKSVNDGSRMNTGIPSGWYVRRPGYKTDPGKPGFSSAALGGNKLFLTWGLDWTAALEEAARWMAERYSLRGEVVSIPGFGVDRFPVEVAEWAKTYPKYALKGEQA